ncbi:hypothetical protein [Archangium violaceum]|uniref:hypothetical protein n=1 Tax=Archangium violaceum TaxID=83451 RepID=UPI0036DBBBF3
MALLLVGAAGLAAAGVYAAARGKGEAAPGVPVSTLPTSERPASGAAAPAVAPPANAGTPPPQPTSGSGGGEVVAKAAEKALDVVFGTAASTVKLGIQAAELQRQFVTSIAGEGAGNAAVLNPMLTVGLTVKTAAEKLGTELGIPADINRRLAQTAGVAVGAPALLPIKVTAEVVSLGIRAVAGEEAERAVRDVVKQFDITDSRNAIHAPVAAVANGVTFVANALQGVFAPPPPPAAKVGMPLQGDMTKWVAEPKAAPVKKPAKLRADEELR